jgi:UDP:flavonoid glycosyltransferase YjiC (YdhE family)
VSPRCYQVAVVTWAPGGNLPPLLAAAALLAARGHRVRVLASAATRPAAERAGFDVHAFGRAPDPDTRVAFERQAAAMMATAAGLDVARDVCELLVDTATELAIVDCMLPAALAAGKATGTPTTSLVHFLYGLARRHLIRDRSAWTTDLDVLNATHRALGLAPVPDGLRAWEATELVLVTAPRWLDVAMDYPPHVIHAGPLGIHTPFPRPCHRGRQAGRVLLSFSTTVMEGQLPAIQRVCDALAAGDTQAVLTLGPAIAPGALRIPDTVDVAVWADHDQLLPSCAAVITHAGLGTTLRALAHGIPLLLLPLGRDQAFNAAQVAKLGAAICLDPDASTAEIRSALDRLLGEQRYSAAAAAIARRIAGGHPDQRAAEALESAHRRRREPSHHEGRPSPKRGHRPEES